MLSKEIEKYIPQRKPFLLVDTIVEASGNSITTEFRVEEDHVLCVSNVLQESGIVENIAQTAAAMEGYNAIENKAPIKLGMIGAVKKLKIYGTAAVNSLLSTRVKAVNEVMGVKIINGQVSVNGKLIAECDMQIYLKEE